MGETFRAFIAAIPQMVPKQQQLSYAHFPDPKTQTEYGFSILMASQYYGEGRCFYLGSPEIWRLRSIEEDYYDRFWDQADPKRGTGSQ